MAKFAVLILAALAFQAASAGVHRYQEKTLGDYEYGVQLHGYPTGKFDALFGQLETVSKDLTTYFQKALPNDRLVIKTLTWQSRELAQYIDAIIEKLQAEAHISGQVSIVLEQVISQLRDIQMQFHQIAAYTPDVYAATQLKSQFYTAVQRTVAQLEKLVHLVQTDVKPQGELYVVVKNVVADFLYAFQSIYTHVQHFGVYGEQSPKQLVAQIEELTSGLTQYLQGVTKFDAQRKYAIRQYLEHVEAIFQRIQKIEGTFDNVEIDAVFQQVYSKLRRVHNIFMQMIGAEYIQNVEVIRGQLIKELVSVAQAFEQFVQYTQGGKYQSFFVEILGDYFYTIQHLKTQMQSEYQGNYGLYQGAFYGKNEFQGYYPKSGYQGLYKNAELYGKSGYKGLKATSYGKGFYGKYQGFAKYGQDLKQFEVQLQTIIRDLYQAIQTVSFEDVTVRQTFVHLVREYVQQLEYIIEQFNQHAETEVYAFQKVAQNLRKYVVALEQFYNGEYSATEFRTQFYTYVQKIAAEFEKLLSGFEQTEGVYYTLVQQVLTQYLTATYDLYRHIENIHEVAQQGFGAYAHQYYGDNYYGGKYYGKYLGGKYGQYYGQQQAYQTPREYGQYYGQYQGQQYYQTPREFGQYYGQYKGQQYYQTPREYGQYYGQYQGQQYYQTPREYGQYYGKIQGQQYYQTPREFGQYYGKIQGQQYYQTPMEYGQYYGKFQGQQQSYETPRELVNQIEYVARDLSATFQNGMFFNQQHAQLLAVHARHFAQIIKNVVIQLEAFEHVDATIQQVIYKLREVQYNFQQLAAYNVFTNVHQFKAQFSSYVQVAVAQIEKLVMIAQEQSQGNFLYVIKDVLRFFLYGLHDIHRQIQQVAQYGPYTQQYGFPKYGQQYGSAKYGQQYGFGKYAQQYGFGKYGQQYAQEYEHPKYGQQYGQEYPKYGQQYGQEYPKYGQQYGFAKYGQQYGQEYPTYGQQYAKQQYNKGYGFDKYSHPLMGLSQYGKGYGYGYQQQVPKYLASAEYNQAAIRAY